MQTHNKPMVKTINRPTFCRMGIVMVTTTGIGMMNIRKSDEMCRYVKAHHTVNGWQYPSCMDTSHIFAIGTHIVKYMPRAQTL